MKKTYDVVVVGLGVMGLATVFELAKRGLKVLGVEQFQAFHDKGSSHGETRVIRRAYFEHPDYIPLLNRSYELWAELEKHTGKKIFEPVGLTIFANPKSSVLYKESLKSAQKFSIPVEELSVAQSQKQFPFFVVPQDFQGLFEPHAGLLYVDEAREGFYNLGKKHGAELRFNTQVSKLELHEGGACLKVGDEKISTAKVVLTSGSWASDLVPELKKLIKIYRTYLYWFECTESFRVGQRMPCFAYHLEGEDFYYGFPSLDGKTFKLAQHFSREEINHPSEKETTSPNSEFKLRMEKFVKNYFPHAGKLQKIGTCLYGLTPDENFILDYHPEHPQLCFATGFSGHGFKFAPVVGEIMASFCTHEKHALNFDHLKLARFTN